MSATATAPTSSKTVDLDRIPWALWMEGLEAKILRCSLGTNRYTLMTKFAPGVELPRHRHMGEVHAVTLSGRWHYREYDWVAGPGSYVFEPALSTHTLHVFEDNDEDTVVIFTIEGGLVLLGENDELQWFEDAEGMLNLYRAALDNAGVPFPEDEIVFE